MAGPNLTPDQSELRARTLSRWDNEGGTIAAVAQEAHAVVPEMANAELVLLRVRVIALENLLIAVLAEGSDQQRQTARDMAEAITPRAGSTQHPLTIRAAQHMSDLVDRAVHVQAGAAVTGAAVPYKSTPVFDETTLLAGLRREHRT